MSKSRPDDDRADSVTKASLGSVAILGTRPARWMLLGLFVLGLTVYVPTCARTVTGEDSGELIAAAYTTGIAHPPGYPLWCMLAKGATWLPVGEVAFRVALLSALLGALTLSVLGAVALVVSQSLLVSTSVALSFGLLRDQWSQAVIAEVYTLNSLLLAASFLLLLVWSERREWKWLYGLGFTVGLGLSNHHTMLAIGPGFLLVILVLGRRSLLQWRRLAVAASSFAAGLLPYAYLPLASSANPPINWGAPKTWDAFLAHITRQHYTESAEAVEQTWGRFASQVEVLLEHAGGQGASLLILVGMGCLVWLVLRRPTHGLNLLSLALLSTLGIILFTNFEPDFENRHVNRLFFVPAYLALLIAAAWGLGTLLRRMPQRAVPVAALALLLVPCGTFISNREQCDYSDYEIAAWYGRRLLKSVSDEAVILPTSDHNSFPLIYLHFVEGLRPDVIVGDKYGYIDPELLRESPYGDDAQGSDGRPKISRDAALKWIVASRDRPVYVSHKTSLRGLEDYALVSEGLWYRIRKRPVSRDEVQRWDELSWGSVLSEGDDPAPLARPIDYSGQTILGSYFFARARYLMRTGDLEATRAAIEKVAGAVPESKEMLNNLGSLLAENGHNTEAAPYFSQALKLDGGYEMARRNLATCLRLGGRIDEAEPMLRELWSENPLDLTAVRGLGEIARQRESWGEAAYFLQRAGEMEHDPRALRDAGLIRLFELEQPTEAKRLLQASLHLDPDQPEVRKVEEQIRPRPDEKPKKAGGMKAPEAPKVPGAAGGEAAAGHGLWRPQPNTPSAVNPLDGVMPRMGTPSANRPSAPNTPKGISGPPKIPNPRGGSR